jgi:hypothetical protein
MGTLDEVGGNLIMANTKVIVGMNLIFVFVFLALALLCGTWMWGWYHADAGSQSWVLHVAIWALTLRLLKDAIMCASNIIKHR